VAAAVSIQWFVACRFTTTRRVDGDYVPRASSVAHAKRMGGTTTACGESAVTMAKLFDVAFPVNGSNCPACLDVVAEELRARRRSAGRGAASGG
jgi:hypothetical protein